MANRIKGITVEIGGDTTKLSKALEGVNKTIKTTQTQLKDVEKLLKLDPTNTELLSQKHKLLAESVSATQDKLETLKTAAEQANTALANGDISQEQYNALQREIIETQQELQRLQTEAENSRTALVKISEAGASLEKVGDKISGVGEKMLPITAGVTALGTAAVKTTANFDAAMSKVSAVSGATGEDFEALRTKAREMGSQTKFSAAEAAEAMNYMAMAGWKTNDMLDGVEGIMNLAAASGEELATTSDIVTDALTALGMSAEESGHFADILAAASSNANTNVSLMGESFKYCAPVAGSMGASAEDLSIALGLMANSGIKGSQAGNSLKNALVNLVKPTKQQAVAMETLGLLTTQTVNKIDPEKVEKAQTAVTNKTLALQKAQISYNDAVAKYGETSSQAEKALISIQQAENNLTQAQNALTTAQQGTIETVGTGQSAFVDEYGNMKSLGEIMAILRENLGAVNVDLVDSEGNAREYEDIIAELSQTEEGLTQAEQLKNAAIIFGKQNLSGMLAIINASESDYNKLTDAIYGCDGTAQNMAETMQDNLSGQLTILMSQLQELAISFGDILMPTIRNIVTKFQELVDKFNALPESTKETIVKVALVAAALGPLLIIFGKVTSGIGKFMQIIANVPAMLTKLKAGFAAVKAAIAGISAPVVAIIAVIALLVAAFKHLWDTNEEFRNSIINIWNGIVAKFQEFFQNITDRINALGFDFESIAEVLKSVWDGLCNYLAPIFEETFALIGEILGDALDVILGIVDVFIGLFSGNWEQAWTGIKEIFSGLWNAIVSTLKSAFSILCNIFGMDLGTVKTFWVDVWTSIKEFFVNIWTNISTFFSTIFTTISNFFTTVWNGIKDFFVGIWTAIFTAVSEKINLIKTVIETVWNAIHTAITTVLNAIYTVISTVWNTIYEFISPLLEAFRYLFETIFQAIQIIISNVHDWISEKISAVWNAIVGFITPILEGIKTFFETIWNAISTAISTVLDTIYNVIMTVWNAVYGYISEILNTIWNFIENIWNTISGYISGVLNAIWTVISTVWNTISTTISSVLNAIFTTISTIWNNIKTTISNVLTNIKTTVTNIWNSVKTAISSTITNIKDTIVNGFNNAVNFVKNLASEAWNWGADIISGIVDGIKSHIQSVADAVTGVADKIRSFLHFSVPDEGPLTDFESWMPDFMQGLADGIVNNQGIVEETLSQFTFSVVERIREALAQAMAVVSESIQGFAETIFTTVADAWNQAGTAIKANLENIKNIVAESWDGISEIISNALSGVQNCVDSVWNDVRTLTEKTLKAIFSTVNSSLNNLLNTSENALKTLQSEITTTFKSILNTVENTCISVKNSTETSWNSVKTTISEMLNSIQNNTSAAWNTIQNSVTNSNTSIKNSVFEIWESLKNGVSERVNSLNETICNSMNGIQDRIIEKVNSSWNWGHDLMQNFVNGIDYLYWSANNLVSNAMTEVQNRMIEKVNSSWDWGRDMMQNLVNGINWMYWDVVNAAAAVAGAISEYLHFSVPDKGPLADFESWMPDFMHGLADGINRNKTVVQKSVSGVAKAMKTAMNSENMAFSFDSNSLISGGKSSAGTTNNYYNTDNSRTINQTNTSPKSLSRLEIYRQTKNALKV